LPKIPENTKKKGILNVVFIGMLRFFTDLITEMVYPLIPLYLTAVFGVTPALIGLIEGIAESLASLLRVYSGYISDRFQRKKALAFTGYATGIIYKLILIFTMSWAGVLIARIIDRFGKGIRTAPRDVLVSESATDNKLGKAFGLHKALDMAGMALGILITYFIFINMGDDFDFKFIFWISIVPAIIGLCMFFFIKEKQTERINRKPPAFWKNFKTLNSQLKLYLLVTLLFTLGNSSNAFLLLKAQAIGFSTVNIILLYFVYSITAALFSFPLGRLSDTVGRKKLLVIGYFVFAAVYLGFAVAMNQPFMFALFILYGLYTAMITGVERAFVAEIAPPQLKGTMLGLHSTVAGIALLPASLITGLLWTAFGSVVPFVFGAVLSFAAAVLLLVFMDGASRQGLERSCDS
jgi:MFS family permease